MKKKWFLKLFEMISIWYDTIVDCTSHSLHMNHFCIINTHTAGRFQSCTINIEEIKMRKQFLKRRIKKCFSECFNFIYNLFLSIFFICTYVRMSWIFVSRVSKRLLGRWSLMLLVRGFEDYLREFKHLIRAFPVNY